MRTIRTIKQRLADDAGMTTAEYAMGTVGAVGIGGLLIKILTSDEARNLIWSVIKGAFSTFGF